VIMRASHHVGHEPTPCCNAMLQRHGATQLCASHSPHDLSPPPHSLRMSTSKARSSRTSSASESIA
jgi:hypothetical protein